jgi:hypothetical protein
MVTKNQDQNGTANGRNYLDCESLALNETRDAMRWSEGLVVVSYRNPSHLEKSGIGLEDRLGQEFSRRGHDSELALSKYKF